MTNLVVFGLLLGFGYILGQRAEKKHFASIIERETRLNALPAIASKRPPTDVIYGHRLVSGNVVIASDYFKSFVAGLVNLFGGRVTSFESLLDRGRREAMLRMKSEAEAAGATYVFNVKYETANISANRRGGAIEVFAYGTALIPARVSPRPVSASVEHPTELSSTAP